MNGIKSDLVESCNSPVVCSECEERLRNERIPTQMIKTVQREIRKIQKPLYYRVLSFVKLHPIIALFISSIFAIALNVSASYIYDKLKPEQVSAVSRNS